MPDTIRTSRSCAHRHMRGIGGFLAARFLTAAFAAAPLPAGAAEQPPFALYQLAVSAHRSIDQHEIAFLAVVLGVVLFAVVTAIMLVRTRVRATRLETWLHNEIARLRDDVDRANALLRSEPQLVVDWPAGGDEPDGDRDRTSLYA